MNSQADDEAREVGVEVPESCSTSKHDVDLASFSSKCLSAIKLVMMNRSTKSVYVCDSLDVSVFNHDTVDLNEIIQTQYVQAFLSVHSRLYVVSTASRGCKEVFVGHYPTILTSERFQQLSYDLERNSQGEINPAGVNQKGGIRIEFDLQTNNNNINEQYLVSVNSLRSETSISPPDQGCVQDDSNEANSGSGSSDLRINERTIKEAMQYVCVWRETYDSVNRRIEAGQKMISYDKVAAELSFCKKKSLDYYFYQFRMAEKFNFDFKLNLNKKMGFLRLFNKKNYSALKQNRKIKIGRDVSFKLERSDLLPIDEALCQRLLYQARITQMEELARINSTKASMAARFEIKPDEVLPQSNSIEELVTVKQIQSEPQLSSSGYYESQSQIENKAFYENLSMDPFKFVDDAAENIYQQVSSQEPQCRFDRNMSLMQMEESFMPDLQDKELGVSLSFNNSAQVRENQDMIRDTHQLQMQSSISRDKFNLPDDNSDQFAWHMPSISYPSNDQYYAADRFQMAEEEVRNYPFGNQMDENPYKYQE